MLKAKLHAPNMSRYIISSGGKLNPSGTTTRAEMAQVLYNLLNK